MLSQKRAVADQPGQSSNKDKENYNLTPTPRKVVKARRRFPDCEGVPNEESTKEDVPSPEKPRFALNGSFDKPTQKKEENAENG